MSVKVIVLVLVMEIDACSSSLDILLILITLARMKKGKFLVRYTVLKETGKSQMPIFYLRFVSVFIFHT